MSHQYDSKIWDICTVGSTFGRFFTVRQMSSNPTGPIQ